MVDRDKTLSSLTPWLGVCGFMSLLPGLLGAGAVVLMVADSWYDPPSWVLGLILLAVCAAPVTQGLALGQAWRRMTSGEPLDEGSTAQVLRRLRLYLQFECAFALLWGVYGGAKIFWALSGLKIPMVP